MLGPSASFKIRSTSLKRLCIQTWRFAQALTTWHLLPKVSNMASRIRVTCTTCGDLEIPADRVRARVCTSDSSADYRFLCTSCDTTIVKACDQHVLDALASVDVEIDLWELPELERKTRQGAGFTHVDIIDFREVLDDEQRFREALADLAL